MFIVGKTIFEGCSAEQNPKAEIRGPKEIRIPKAERIAVQTTGTSVFALVSRKYSAMNTEPTVFGFRSSSFFRISAFGFTPSSCPLQTSKNNFICCCRTARTGAGCSLLLLGRVKKFRARLGSGFNAPLSRGFLSLFPEGCMTKILTGLFSLVFLKGNN